MSSPSSEANLEPSKCIPHGAWVQLGSGQSFTSIFVFEWLVWFLRPKLLSGELIFRSCFQVSCWLNVSTWAQLFGTFWVFEKEFSGHPKFGYSRRLDSSFSQKIKMSTDNYGNFQLRWKIGFCGIFWVCGKSGLAQYFRGRFCASSVKNSVVDSMKDSSWGWLFEHLLPSASWFDGEFHDFLLLRIRTLQKFVSSFSHKISSFLLFGILRSKVSNHWPSVFLTSDSGPEADVWNSRSSDSEEPVAKRLRFEEGSKGRSKWPHLSGSICDKFRPYNSTALRRHRAPAVREVIFPVRTFLR